MEESVAELQKAIALSGGNSVYVAGLGDAYALGGNKAEAIILRSQLDQKTTYVSPYWMATLHASRPWGTGSGIGFPGETFLQNPTAV
jgi:hypothetical protein